MEYSIGEELSREDMLDTSSNLNDRASKITQSKKLPILNEVMKDYKTEDSQDILKLEVKFSQTHGA